jgi:hypothetical protein
VTKGRKDKMTLGEVKRVDTFNDLINGLSEDYAKKNTFSQKARISILFALLRLEHSDIKITAMTEKLIE